MLKRLPIAAAAVIAVTSAASAVETYRVAGGPSGGGWHPAWSAGVQVLNQELGKKYSFQYLPTAGSVDNMRKVRQQEVATGWVHIVQIYQSWKGTKPFDKEGANQDYRIIGNVRQQAQVIAVLADSPIKSFSDMKGKVVNLLNKGSGSSVNCIAIFEALGLMESIQPRYMGFSESARALGDQQVDVFCSAGIPHIVPALTELSIRKPVRYITMTDEEQKKVMAKNPFYAPVTIPVLKDVKGMTEPAKTIGYDVWWLVTKKLPDSAVYDMLKSTASPEALKKLAATAGYWKTLSGNFDTLKPLGLPIHPAAAKYWKEQGAKVPEELVKGF